jgi:hypothetical protein
MAIGTSLFLIALGAILKFAVTAKVAGIELQTVGVILMLVGALGLVISLAMLARGRNERGEPVDPYGTEPRGYGDRRV